MKHVEELTFVFVDAFDLDVEQGVRVVPIPGACAAIAALSASGLPTDRFVFEGFLPSKQAARKNSLQTLRSEQFEILALFMDAR